LTTNFVEILDPRARLSSRSILTVIEGELDLESFLVLRNDDDISRLACIIIIEDDRVGLPD